MATVISLDPATIAALDAVVAKGRFSSHDEAIRSALYIVEEADASGHEPLTPEEIAGIERGLADADAGRLITIADIRAEMQQRFASRA